MDRRVVVFDLDDTLYKEIDFLKSGYRKVAELVERRHGIDAGVVYDNLLGWYRKGDNPFVILNDYYGIHGPIDDYLKVYRYHQPTISLTQEVRDTLTTLTRNGAFLGMISDGRVITQRQKISALGLTEWISEDAIIINEEKVHFKPSRWGYERMMALVAERYPHDKFLYYYVGDNPGKDFVAPNELGWTSICLLDHGENIHQQDFTQQSIYLPKFKINSLPEILRLF